MRGIWGFVSILITLGLGLGIYVMYIRTAGGNMPGGNPTSAISTTSVKMQLLSMANAERTNYVQNNPYASIDELKSSGSFTPREPDPDGYSYDVTVAKDPDSFTITASHPPAPNGSTANFPSFSIDQSMTVAGGN